MFKIFRQRRISLGLKKSGFTLIEMLMVISLVSLLASIVMATIGNATDKAKIASTQQFAASVSGQLRDNIVAIWNFNDTNDPGKDSWEGKNDGTLTCVGLGETCITDSANSSMGKALRLNGNDFVTINSSASLNVDNTLTIEAWIKPVNTARATIYSHGSNASGGFQFEINGQGVGSFGTIIAGVWISYSGISLIETSKWSHIAYTRRGTGGGTHTLYLNGVPQTLAINAANNYTDQTANSLIGAKYTTSQRFNGLIDEVHIYNAALTAQEVQQRYAESAPRHGMAIK